MRVQMTGGARAVQYRPGDTAELMALELSTGAVVLQEENKLTKATARCYVPTAFGTHILDPGDWVVVHDSGYVFTIPDGVLELVSSYEEPAEHSEDAPWWSTSSFAAPDVLLLRVRIEEDRKDWDVEVDEQASTYQLVQVSSGLSVGSWLDGDSVTIYDDGTVEVVS